MGALDISDIGHPDLVGRCGFGRLGRAKGGDGLVMVAVGGLKTVVALLTPAQAGEREDGPNSNLKS
jgi:hypothetical protein